MSAWVKFAILELSFSKNTRFNLKLLAWFCYHLFTESVFRRNVPIRPSGSLFFFSPQIRTRHRCYPAVHYVKAFWFYTHLKPTGPWTLKEVHKCPFTTGEQECGSLPMKTLTGGLVSPKSSSLAWEELLGKDHNCVWVVIIKSNQTRGQKSLQSCDVNWWCRSLFPRTR